ncbi:AEC family transporter [Oscillospiraceae bacterium PP1C4]
MENAKLAFEIIFPLAAMMGLGYALRLLKLWDELTLARMNGIVFRIFFPIQLFTNIYHTELESAFDKRLTMFAIITVLVSAAAIYMVVPLFVKDASRCGVMIQGAYRSNFILFGLPIAAAVSGGGGAGVASVLIAFIVPIFNMISVVILERYRGAKPNIKKMLIGIASNPLIITSITGLLVLKLGIHLPDMLDKTMTDISKVNTPLALMVLGGTFRFSAVRANLRALIAAMTVRLIIVPAVFLPIAIGMGFHGVQLAVLLGMYAAPTAVSSFTMAQQMDADYELAGQIVVFSSLCSVLTIFGWVFLFKQLGYL